METLGILLLIGFGIYQVLIFNTKMGMETVRAFIYLQAMRNGANAKDASATCDINTETLDPRDAVMAKAFVRKALHGKQLPLIRLAYHNGMPPRLPGWYRAMAHLHST